jgi:hypothetical protein
MAGGLSGGMALLYVGLISGEGTGFGTRVAFVGGWLAVAAVFLLLAAFTLPLRRRSLLAGIGSAMLLPLAVAAMFSIGILILPLAVMGGASASIAAHEAGIGPWQRAAAALGLVAVSAGLLLLGFQLTA